eukprot:366371-Chlamydomonas_euryale.AAC.22
MCCASGERERGKKPGGKIHVLRARGTWRRLAALDVLAVSLVPGGRQDGARRTPGWCQAGTRLVLG